MKTIASCLPAVRFLSVCDAATYSGLGEPTIRRLLRTGMLTAYRPVPGRVLVDRTDLDRLFQESVGRRGTRGASGARGSHSDPESEVN